MATEKENKPELTEKASGATCRVDSSGEKNRFGIVDVTNASSSKDNTDKERVNLIGILELANRFCHDNQEDHNVEVEEGVAEGLTKLLERSIMLYEQRKAHYDDDRHSERFKNSAVAHVASLSTSLAKVLQCSNAVLTSNIENFGERLVATLDLMVRNFVQVLWEEGDTSLQQTILTNMTNISKSIHSHLKDRETVKRLLDTLLGLLDTHWMSSSSGMERNIVDAICDILSLSCTEETKREVAIKLEPYSSSLISVLTTASVIPMNKDKNDQQFEMDFALRLFQMSELQSIRLKMMNRRCTVLAVSRQFGHRHSDIRTKAYLFCHDLINQADLITDSYSSGLDLNVQLVEDGLIEYLSDELDPKIQELGASLLRKVVLRQAFPSSSAMDLVKRLVFSTHSDENMVIACGKLFCEGLEKDAFPTKENLQAMIEMANLPFAEIRQRSLVAIPSFLSRTECVGMLLDETEMLETFALVIDEDGADDEREAALDVTRQLARSSRNHPRLCQNHDLLKAIVDFVLQEEISNRTAHYFGIEILLSLLSNHEMVGVFVPFRRLLPWLVKFLNTTTTTNEAFKEQLVAVIINLSSAYLSD